MSARGAFKAIQRASPAARQAYRGALKHTNVASSAMVAGAFFAGATAFHVAAVRSLAPALHGVGVVLDGLGGGASAAMIENVRTARGMVVRRALEGALGKKAQSIARDHLEVFRASKLVGPSSVFEHGAGREDARLAGE